MSSAEASIVTLEQNKPFSRYSFLREISTAPAPSYSWSYSDPKIPINNESKHSILKTLKPGKNENPKGNLVFVVENTEENLSILKMVYPLENDDNRNLLFQEFRVLEKIKGKGGITITSIVETPEKFNYLHKGDPFTYFKYQLRPSFFKDYEISIPKDSYSKKTFKGIPRTLTLEFGKDKSYNFENSVKFSSCLCIQLCNALTAIQHHNIAHNDISSNNILVDENHNVLLIDFEKAVDFKDLINDKGELTWVIERVGTPGFDHTSHNTIWTSWKTLSNDDRLSGLNELKKKAYSNDMFSVARCIYYVLLGELWSGDKKDIETYLYKQGARAISEVLIKATSLQYKKPSEFNRAFEKACEAYKENIKPLKELTEFHNEMEKEIEGCKSLSVKIESLKEHIKNSLHRAGSFDLIEYVTIFSNHSADADSLIEELLTFVGGVRELKNTVDELLINASINPDKCNNVIKKITDLKVTSTLDKYNAEFKRISGEYGNDEKKHLKKVTEVTKATKSPSPDVENLSDTSEVTINVNPSENDVFEETDSNISKENVTFSCERQVNSKPFEVENAANDKNKPDPCILPPFKTPGFTYPPIVITPDDKRPITKRSVHLFYVALVSMVLVVFMWLYLNKITESLKDEKLQSTPIFQNLDVEKSKKVSIAKNNTDDNKWSKREPKIIDTSPKFHKLGNDGKYKISDPLTIDFIEDNSFLKLERINELKKLRQVKIDETASNKFKEIYSNTLYLTADDAIKIVSLWSYKLDIEKVKEKVTLPSIARLADYYTKNNLDWPKVNVLSCTPFDAYDDECVENKSDYSFFPGIPVSQENVSKFTKRWNKREEQEGITLSKSATSLEFYDLRVVKSIK